MTHTSELIPEREGELRYYRRAREPRSHRDSPGIYLLTPEQYNVNSLGDKFVTIKKFGLYFFLFLYLQSLVHCAMNPPNEKHVRLDNKGAPYYSQSGKLTNPAAHPEKMATTVNQKGVANNELI